MIAGVHVGMNGVNHGLGRDIITIIRDLLVSAVFVTSVMGAVMWMGAVMGVYYFNASGVSKICVRTATLYANVVANAANVFVLSVQQCNLAKLMAVRK